MGGARKVEPRRSEPRKPEPRKPEPPKPEPSKPEPRKPASAGTFTIDSKPWATIYVDGARLGMTPIFRRSLPAGRHTVKAVASGKTKTFTIDVQPGAEVSRRLTW